MQACPHTEWRVSTSSPSDNLICPPPNPTHHPQQCAKFTNWLPMCKHCWNLLYQVKFYFILPFVGQKFCQEGNWCEIPPQAVAIGLGPLIEFFTIFFSSSEFNSILFTTGFFFSLISLWIRPFSGNIYFGHTSLAWCWIWFKYCCYLAKVGQVNSNEHSTYPTAAPYCHFVSRSWLMLRGFIDANWMLLIDSDWCWLVLIDSGLRLGTPGPMIWNHLSIMKLP